MLTKLEKYESHMCSELNMIALVLDPRIGNSNSNYKVWKDSIRRILNSEYGYSVNDNQTLNDYSKGFDIFALVDETNMSSSNIVDEVDDFFMLTSKGDRSCKDILLWWKHRLDRFACLGLLARDTFMAMGSSVPSESAFSDSGDYISVDRSMLTNENVSIMIKLRALNRLVKNLE